MFPVAFSSLNLVLSGCVHIACHCKGDIVRNFGQQFGRAVPELLHLILCTCGKPFLSSAGHLFFSLVSFAVLVKKKLVPMSFFCLAFLAEVYALGLSH